MDHWVFGSYNISCRHCHSTIAIHNIPEGIAIAGPISYATNSKSYAVAARLISGLAESRGAAIGYWRSAPYLSQPVFGLVLGMIIDVMVFLALDELLPAAKRYAQRHETVPGLVAGVSALAVGLILFKW